MEIPKVIDDYSEVEGWIESVKFGQAILFANYDNLTNEIVVQKGSFTSRFAGSYTIYVSLIN